MDLHLRTGIDGGGHGELGFSSAAYPLSLFFFEMISLHMQSGLKHTLFLPQPLSKVITGSNLHTQEFAACPNVV